MNPKTIKKIYYDNNDEGETMKNLKLLYYDL